MKRINYFLITLFLMTGFAGGSKQSTDELVVIDVTKSYPKKELRLQDVVDVEYIPFETTDEFLCPGNLKTTVSENFIAVTDPKGSIILFDRTGKGLRNINKRGQGPGEYLMVSDIAIDENNNELFVLDLILTQIFVYDLQGKFIRTFKFQDGYNALKIINLDKEHLMCMGFINHRILDRPFSLFQNRMAHLKSLLKFRILKRFLFRIIN